MKKKIFLYPVYIVISLMLMYGCYVAKEAKIKASFIQTKLDFTVSASALNNAVKNFTNVQNNANKIPSINLKDIGGVNIPNISFNIGDPLKQVDSRFSLDNLEGIYIDSVRLDTFGTGSNSFDSFAKASFGLNANTLIATYTKNPSSTNIYSTTLAPTMPNHDLKKDLLDPDGTGTLTETLTIGPHINLNINPATPSTQTFATDLHFRLSVYLRVNARIDINLN